MVTGATAVAYSESTLACISLYTWSRTIAWPPYHPFFSHEIKHDHEHGVSKHSIKEDIPRLCSATRPSIMSSQPLELTVDLPDFDIPDTYLTAIPSPNAHTPVNRFRFHVLQPRLNSLVFPTAAASFSTAPPSGTYNLCDLPKAPIPPASYLRSLKGHLADLSPDDRLSLRSVRNPANTEELLPLWVLTVWEEVSWLTDSQEKWKTGYSWVRSLQDTHRTAATFSHLEALGWNSLMSLYGLRGITNLSLVQFLSDDRVNDEAIDLMSHFLAAKPTLPHNILIADLRLPRFISAQDHTFRPPPAHICELEGHIAHAAALYFPMFYNKYKHWIAFKVDLLRKEVMYGKPSGTS